MIKIKLTRTKTYRTQTGGQFISELPLALTFAFFFVFAPLINLATATLRAYFVRQTCLEAVHRAAKAATFVNDIPAAPPDPPELSADTIANQTLTQFLQSGYCGSSTIQMPVELVCVREGFNGGTAEWTTPLPPSAVNPAQNAYYYEIRTTATAAPFFTYSGPWFAHVPGLTGPMELKVCNRQMVEHTEGLTN